MITALEIALVIKKINNPNLYFLKSTSHNNPTTCESFQFCPRYFSAFQATH